MKFSTAVAIPLLLLATSKIAGTLLGAGHFGLAVFGALIRVVVSLPNMAWAIRDVTKSSPRGPGALTVAPGRSLAWS